MCHGTPGKPSPVISDQQDIDNEGLVDRINASAATSGDRVNGTVGPAGGICALCMGGGIPVGNDHRLGGMRGTGSGRGGGTGVGGGGAPALLPPQVAQVIVGLSPIAVGWSLMNHETPGLGIDNPFTSDHSGTSAQPDPDDEEDEVDHIVLGKSNGLADRAQKIGGRHLMGDPYWEQTVRRAAADPRIRISVALDDVSGTSTYNQVMAAVTRGASGRGAPFDLEMFELRQADRLKNIDFYRNGVRIENPFK